MVGGRTVKGEVEDIGVIRDKGGIIRNEMKVRKCT